MEPIPSLKTMLDTDEFDQAQKDREEKALGAELVFTSRWSKSQHELATGKPISTEDFTDVIIALEETVEEVLNKYFDNGIL